MPTRWRCCEPGRAAIRRHQHGHLALAELERRGKLHALITQNIDELHRLAGHSAARIIEVHGTMRRAM